MRIRSALPPRPFVYVLLLRASAFWLLGRLILAMFSAPRSLQALVGIGLPTSAGLIALVAALSMFELHRRHEAILLANLGIARSGILATALLPPLLLELATWLIPL